MDSAGVVGFGGVGATLSTGSHGQGDPMQWAGNVYPWPAAGSFPAGATIRYAIQVVDNRGKVLWLNNGGKDYSVRVNP